MPKTHQSQAYRLYANGITNWDGFLLGLVTELARVETERAKQILEILPPDISARIKQEWFIADPPINPRGFPIHASYCGPEMTEQEWDAVYDSRLKGAMIIHRFFFGDKSQT